MTSPHPFIARLRHPMSWVTIALGALVTCIGYRGLSLTSYAQLDATRNVARILSDGFSLRALQDTLNTPHPHIDLFSALWIRLIPLDHALALSALSALAMFLCAYCIGRIIMRHTGGNQIAASCAALTFCVLPGTVAQLGGPSTTLLTCAFLLVLWDMCTLVNQRWWQALIAWLAGALLLGSWSPMLLWSCLLLLAHLKANAHPPEHNPDRGLIARSTIPPGVLLCVPMVPLLATLIHPGFWPDIKHGWLMCLESGWLKSSPLQGVGVDGRWYEQGKLSFFAASLTLVRQVPLVTLLMGLPGVWWLVQTKRSAHHYLLLWSLPAMCLITWATPGGDYGRIAQSTILLVLCSLIVGHGIAWCMHQSSTRGWHRAIVPVLVALTLTSALLPTLAFWHTPASWQSGITGGAEQAQRLGDTHSAHLTLPRTALGEQIATRQLTELHAGMWNPILREYALEDLYISEAMSPTTPTLAMTPRFTADMPVRPAVLISQREPLIFLGKSAAPAFFLTTPSK